MPFGRIHDPIGDGRDALPARRRARGRRRAASGTSCSPASRGIWAEAVDVARDPGLRAVCERAGLSWAACAAALEDPALRARVDANTARAGGLGHWGVPVFVLGDELFWGQDRIEDLEAALREAGLERR